MPAVIFPPPREAGPGPADPAVSASFSSYTGSGYGQVGGPPNGTINVGNPASVGPQFPGGQVRFFVMGGNLYILDNVSGQTFFVSPSGLVPVPGNYSATRPT